jgi:hypothetical protein
LFTVSDNGVGSTSSLGLAFDLGKRWSLATGCTFRTLNYEAQGQLNLPNIGAPVPTVYGDSKHMMVMACPHLRVEFFLKPKFSIMLGGGASFAERFVEYSPGYRSWASQWVVSQPAERELFSLSGPEVSLGLRWYWR